MLVIADSLQLSEVHPIIYYYIIYSIKFNSINSVIFT